MNRTALVSSVLVLAATSTLLAQADGGERGGSSGIRGVINDIEPTNDNIASPTAIDFQGRSTAVGIMEFDTAGDIDFFSVNAAANEIFAVFTIPLDSLPNGFQRADTILRLYNAANVQIVTDDDAGSTFPGLLFPRSSAIRFVAPAAGAVKFSVEEFSDQTGRYALLVCKVNTVDYTESSGASIDTAAVVANSLIGPYVGNAFTGTADLDYYAVDMNPGDILLAATTSIRGAPSNLNDPNMQMRLIAPDQTTTLVTSLDDGGGNLPGGSSTSNNTFILARANQKGRFYLEVAPTGSTAVDDAYRIVTWVVPGAFCPGDADGSGRVTFTDITTVLVNFGNSCP